MTIKTCADPRENARILREYLEKSHGGYGGTSHKNRILEPLFSDTCGLLDGIANGTIKNGQPRIATNLVQMTQNYPEGKDPSLTMMALQACAETGLSAENHIFPGTLRTKINESKGPER